MSKLEEMLIRHEGLKLKPYKCTAGKLTIGIGRNLDDIGITDAEARMMLNYDIARVTSEALLFRWFPDLDQPRKDVILNMLFNLGLARFRGFKKFIAAMSRGDYSTAAKEMLDSKWADQVKGRALELAKIMDSGKY